MDKRAAFDCFAEFFPHLAHDRRRRGFADLDAAARQRPVRIARRTMHEQVTGIDHDGRGTDLEALTVKMD